MARTEDLVIIDGAETIPTELALAAIARGRQVVVLGSPQAAAGTLAGDARAVLPTVALPTMPSTRPWPSCATAVTE